MSISFGRLEGCLSVLPLRGDQTVKFDSKMDNIFNYTLLNPKEGGDLIVRHTDGSPKNVFTHHSSFPYRTYVFSGGFLSGNLICKE